MLKACSISRNINRQAVQILRQRDISVDVWSGEKSPSKEELQELLRIYDILIIGVKEKITKDMISNIKSRKIIGTLSIGLNHIEKECFESDYVDIVNCPTANVTSVAEHIFALILDLSKRIQEANDLVIEGKGDKRFLRSKPSDICGKTIGLIGAGNISSKVVDIANIFQMPILCYTAHPGNHEDLIKKGVKFVSLDEVLQCSDIVNVSVPLTEQTKNLISREKVDLLKENAIFINTSRGEVTDVQALVELADRNPNFYLGLDIDIEQNEELLSRKRSNIITTPHIADCTDEAIQRTYIECAENIVKVLERRKEEKDIEGR